MTTNLSKIQYPKKYPDELMSEERVFRVVFVSTDGSNRPVLVTEAGTKNLSPGLKISLGQNDTF